MINRPLIALVLVLAAAGTAHAQARNPIGGATTPRPALTADPLGPRSDPTPTVAESVARVQIEKAGYTGVRGLVRIGDGAWRAAARNQSNVAVAVTLDNQGKVSEMR
jgi:hypothetical protein